ncbi:MAG: DUF374 domain-containing protein [Pirellulales bacterium]|nr:DUF374 domain-containing protein [Pirellulales bacterium]
MKRLLPWLVGLVVVTIRFTCRFRIHDDPRQRLSQQGTPHVFAALHAHQVAAGMAADAGTCAMVSRSQDGQIIVPSLKLLGHIPVRGSGGVGARKGGAVALQTLVKYVHRGHPAILAIDGPRGPRGQVHRGIGLLAKRSHAAVLAVLVIPRRRWILSKTWDRLQIPQPFTQIEVHFSEPLFIGDDETLSAFAMRVQIALHELESEHDPTEAAAGQSDPSATAPPSRRGAA